jgi:hypothetical protein
MPRIKTFVVGLALVLAGCDSTTTSGNPAQDFEATHRAISPALRASCSDTTATIQLPVAQRALDTVVQVVVTRPASYRLQLRIYDSTGSFLAHSESSMSLVAPTGSTQTQRIVIAWNGADSTGSFVESGRYFLFDRILDSTGAVVKIDSSCYTWVRGPTN